MTSARWLLSAAYRSPHLAVALVADGRILELRRHLVGSERRADRSMRAILTSYARDYAVDAIVVEPKSLTSVAATNTRYPVHLLGSAEATEGLLNRRGSRQELYQYLLKREPLLRRFVVVLKTGQVTETDPWRTVLLLAVALAFAADRLTAADRSAPHSRTINHNHIV